MKKELSLPDYEVIATPSGYARVRCGVDQYKWQIKFVDSIEDEYTRTCATTCNESGKTSFCIAPTILWHMDTFPGSLVVTTSASNKQIKFQLYPQLKRITGPWDGWVVRDSNEHSVRAPNGSLCVSYSTDDPELIEGFHEWPASQFMAGWTPPPEWEIDDWEFQENVPLLIVVDEAKGVEDVFHDALDRCRPTRLMVASSPGMPIGRLYDYNHSWKKKFLNRDTGEHNLVHISYRDCPHLIENEHKRQQIEEDIEIRGRDDAWVKSSIFGQFAQSGDDMVFDLFKVDAAMSGQVRHYDPTTVRAAVDLSGGTDETVVYVRRGNRAELVFTSHERDATVLVEKLIMQFEKSGFSPSQAHMIRADEGGLGDPICDMLKKRGWDIERIDFSKLMEDTDRYGNKRCSMYFNLARLISKGSVILPRDDILREQLGWQKYKMDERNILWMISKRKMPKSPDRADTVAMLFDEMPPIETFEDLEEMHRRRLSPSLPTEQRLGFEWSENEAEEALFY